MQCSSGLETLESEEFLLFHEEVRPRVVGAGHRQGGTSGAPRDDWSGGRSKSRMSVKCNLGLLGLIVGAAAALLLIQHQTQAKLREDIKSLREQMSG